MLTQDYIEGQSLYALVQQKRVTEYEVRSVARQILEILDYLHHQTPAIIHRDIKPSSLVLSDATSHTPGKIYLVDFGLVQSGDKAQPDDLILMSGTPGYRPFEQLGDKAVPATDLYSLGATLVHLATGQHPNTLPQRGLRILFGQELGHMGRPIKSWLRWLTQPKQYKRPQSAHAALYGLEQADKIFAPANPLSLGGLGQRCQRALLETMAPSDTQLKLVRYSQTLEILFPALGWQSRHFCFAFLQIAASAGAIGLTFQSCLLLWPQMIVWQRLLICLISLGWIHLSLRWGYRGVKSMITTLFQQMSIQLLPDIILLGHRFPCRPVDYQVNTYKQDIEDIDLQPGSDIITFRLRRNRTLMGNLEYALAAQALGVTQAEIDWINSILQLWLKQGVSQGSVWA